MSTFCRPTTLADALAALAEPGSRVLAGGTDLSGLIDRGLASPTTVIDVQDAGLDRIERCGAGVRIGATATLATVAVSDLLTRWTALREAAAAAASPLLRNVATVGGNLCQHTRCWYYRGVEWTCWLGGGDTCFAQIGEHERHGLQPGDCISAHPSDLAPALIVSDATVVVASATGIREQPVAALYRRPDVDDRSLLTLGPDEVITHVVLPAPPDASVYLREGQREAFSFPLVGLAVARFGERLVMAAAGVANIPHLLDPDDVLHDLPGNPQSAWKRTVLATLASRGRTAVTM